jgi:DNA-binding Xre family transcriptional regulator
MTESRMATPEELASIGIKKDRRQPSLIDCPVYKDDLDQVAAKKKLKTFQNALQEQLHRLMNYKRIEAADIHKSTGIAHSTLSEWINGKVGVQLLDDNIKKLARYFDCSIDFMVYGTPVTTRDLELDDIMPSLDEEYKE